MHVFKEFVKFAYTPQLLKLLRGIAKSLNLFRESMSYDTFVTTLGAWIILPCVPLSELFIYSSRESICKRPKSMVSISLETL